MIDVCPPVAAQVYMESAQRHSVYMESAQAFRLAIKAAHALGPAFNVMAGTSDGSCCFEGYSGGTE